MGKSWTRFNVEPVGVSEGLAHCRCHMLNDALLDLTLHFIVFTSSVFVRGAAG
jgi:hypothetical protein